MYYILSNKLFCCCCCNKQTTSHLHQNFSRNPTKRDVQIVVAKLWSFVYFFFMHGDNLTTNNSTNIIPLLSLSSLVSSANWFESSRFHRSCWRYHDCAQINLTLSGEESCKFHTKKTHLNCLSSNSWAATIHYHTFRSVILFWPIWLN